MTVTIGGKFKIEREYPMTTSFVTNIKYRVLSQKQTAVRDKHGMFGFIFFTKYTCIQFK